VGLALFRLSCLAPALGVVAALSFARPSGAAEPSAADRTTARTLAQEGYEALRDKQYAVAADRFSRANGLVHAPTLLRDLARAQVGLGRLVDAHETYTTILREGVAEDAPAPWVKAVADAKTELAEVSARLPWITVTVTGPAHPKVTIDGAPIGEASLGVKRPIDPGRHEVRAIADGYHTAKKSVVVKDGESVNVAFELEDAPADAPPKAEEDAGHVSVATVKAPAWFKPVTIGAFALGGAGLVLGGVTGILAIRKHSELSKLCPSERCEPTESSKNDRYVALATTSTVGFIAGGVGVASGVLLLLIRPQSLVAQPPAGSAPPANGPRSGLLWSPFFGLGSAGVEGTF
jgi:hypothetical protein